MRLRPLRLVGLVLRALAVLGLLAALILPAAAQQPPPPQQIRVVEVVVQGNRNVATETILRVIATRPGDVLLQDRLAADVQSIIALGWFADVVVRVDQVPGGARVTFVVVENPVVTRISIAGNTVISADELLARFPVPLGQVLNSNTLRDGLRAIEGLYDERGYILARVANVDISEAGALTLTIAEGRIQEVQITGLKRTQRRIIERELTIKAGDVFNINTINADLQRIFQLGLFETIRVVPSPGAQPDAVIVTIEVVEQRTGEIKLGISYSARSGILGSVEVGENNFRGRAQRLSVRYERAIIGGTVIPIPGIPSIGEPRPVTQFEVNFQEPYFDTHRTAVGIRVFQFAQQQQDFISGAQFFIEQFGSQVTALRPLGTDTVAGLTLRSIRTNITALSGGAVSLTPGLVQAIGAQWARDRRNDRLNPSRGDRLAASLEYAFAFLGGDFTFLKGSAEYTRYVPLNLLKNSTLVLHGYAGAASPTCATTPPPGCVPLQDEFLVGGQTTLRGYLNGQFRGNLAAVANVEFRFPLTAVSARLPVETMGIVFADAGFASRTGFVFGTKTVGYDLGVGVLVQTPIGPIRIDYGIGPKGSQTWLSFGHPF